MVLDYSFEEEEELFEYLLSVTDDHMKGWDFSTVGSRMVTQPLGWSYHSIVLSLLPKVKSLFDMGTGGGEFLSTLPLPRDTVASENYGPNVPIAKNRLEPLGVEVITFEEDSYVPLPDTRFDLVTNRHESYDASEIRRLLRRGGVFLTQQVGADNNLELNEGLGAGFPEDYNPAWTASYLCEELEEVGMRILVSRSEKVNTRFFDIGALVFYLRSIPWQIPGFSVEKYRHRLFAIHHEILQKGYFESTEQRYLVIARK